jgi:hypothetical protein
MKSTQTIRITVRGRLSKRLGAAFDGMTVVPRTGATDLVGELVDQAQMHGLLTRIRDLGLELQSLNLTDARVDNQPHEGAQSWLSQQNRRR